jgi:hypothetical protein
MEIKDPRALYHFFGQLDPLVAWCIMLMIAGAVFYFSWSLYFKITRSKRIALRGAFVSAVVIGICIVIVSSRARKSNLATGEANALKSFLVTQNWKFLSLRRIAEEVTLSAQKPALGRRWKIETELRKREQDIRQLVDAFPNEFVLSNIDDWTPERKMVSNIEGVQLVDRVAVKAIDAYYESMVPFFQMKIAAYMQEKQVQTILYSGIRDSIDDRCQDYLLDKMVAQSKGLFTPVNVRMTAKDSVLYYAIRYNKQQ